MPTCRICGKKGLFLTVNQFQICKDCETRARLVLQENLRLYNNAIIYLEDPANPEEIIRSIQEARVALKQLISLENKNLLSKNHTPPSELSRRFEEQTDKFYLDYFDYEFKALVTQVTGMKIKRYQVERIDKFLAKCNKHKEDLKDKNCLGDLIFKAMMLKKTISDG